MTTQSPATPDNSFITPVGRIVGGMLHEMFEKTKQDGTKVSEFVVMLAMPVADPETVALVARIKALGAAAFSAKPHHLQRPDFAWKMIEGDSAIPNTEGKVPNTREGFPGHIILTLTTQYPFQTCGPNPNDLIDASTVKRGDWVRLAGNIVGNGRDDKPGIYANLRSAMFIRPGEEIQTASAVTAATAFGGLVPGQATPAMPGRTVMPGLPATASGLPGVPGLPTAVAPAMPAAPPMPTATAPVAPIAPGGVPAMPVAPAMDLVNAVAPPLEPVLTALAVSQGVTVAAALAAGHTLEQLKAAGYIQ